MIVSKLWAQLGNQCFMASAAICHALKMNTNYAFPAKTTAPRIWRTYLNHLPVIRPNQATRDFYKETGPEYSPLPESNDLTIEGYFQSEKYWHNYKEQLAEILGFKHTPADYVAIHIRRGDYLQYSDRFPVLPIEYYEKAIQYFIGKGHDNFKVYSDDIEWCKKTFIDMSYHFSYSEKKDPISDMKDMYNASGYILANSTFGLFPALLRIDNPLVIGPEDHRWFGPNGQDMNSSDRLPNRFIQI